MSSTHILRPAKPEDHRVLSDIAYRSKAWWGYSDAFLMACRDELTYSPDQICEHTFFVSLASPTNREIAGFYGLVRTTETVIELEALFIAPSHIGCGHGGQLFRHAVEQARASGAERITILADPNAESFYRKLGAKLIEQKESSSFPGRFLPLLEIPLNDDPKIR